MSAGFAFEHFVLDTRDRRLRADDAPVELNGRYFDALALLVGDSGRLVSKDRFMAEVWRGIPVTDEALTQCIRTLRRQLGDDAARPRFIETVPKHGYRFIAPVRELGGAPGGKVEAADTWRQFLLLGSAGTLGGAVAGAAGGLVYGFAAASQSGIGAMSILLVLLCVTVLVAIIGAAAVSFAIATSVFARTRSCLWLTVAGAAGGLLVGAFGKLLGHDVFTLLVGRAPSDITGAMEGLLIGAAVGFARWMGMRSRSIRIGAALAAAIGALTGTTIVLLGGRLMLGSLALLTGDFPESRLQVGQVGRLFGETGFGPVTQIVSAALEAALFSGCVVAALILAQRKIGQRA